MYYFQRYVLGVMHYAFAVVLLFLLVNNSQAFLDKSRSKTFNKQEIERMKLTTAVLETKFGEITLKFFPEVAPKHVNSFIELASSGFYDGTTFHRVVPGFVIQGGDPNTKSEDRSQHGTGGPGYTLEAEFSDIPHKRVPSQWRDLLILTVPAHSFLSALLRQPFWMANILFLARLPRG